MDILRTRLLWRALHLKIFGEAFPPKPEVLSGQFRGHFIETFSLEATVALWHLNSSINVHSYIILVHVSASVFYQREGLFLGSLSLLTKKKKASEKTPDCFLQCEWHIEPSET